MKVSQNRFWVIGATFIAALSTAAWAGESKRLADLNCPVAELQKAFESRVIPSIQLLNLVIISRDDAADSREKNHKEQYAALASLRDRYLQIGDVFQLTPLTTDCKTYIMLGYLGLLQAVPKTSTSSRSTELAALSKSEIEKIEHTAQARVTEMSADALSAHYPKEPAIRIQVTQVSEKSFLVKTRFMSSEALADTRQPIVDRVYSVKFEQGLSRSSLSGWASDQVSAALK